GVGPARRAICRGVAERSVNGAVTCGREDEQMRKLPEFPVEGGCQCGAVRYRVTAAPATVYRCHCKDCQRLSGAAWSMSMVMAAERVELLKGTLVSYDKA